MASFKDLKQRRALNRSMLYANNARALAKFSDASKSAVDEKNADGSTPDSTPPSGGGTTQYPVRAEQPDTNDRSVRMKVCDKIMPADIPSSIRRASSTGISSLEPSDTLPYRLEENEALEVRKTKFAGRGIFWAPQGDELCKKGTTLLRLRPHISVLGQEEVESHCHVCFEPQSHTSRFQRCSACRYVRYCSVNCQKTDWAIHKTECKALQAWQAHANARDPRPDCHTRTLARLIWKRPTEGEKWWNQLDSMQSNRAQKASEQIQSIAGQAYRLCRYIGIGTSSRAEREEIYEEEANRQRLADLGFDSVQQLLDFVCKFETNSFTASSSDLSPCGLAVCPTAALINHSCLPNAVVVFPFGPGDSGHTAGPMRVVAIKDVEPGQEITTAYVDLSDSYTKRRKTLSCTYSFECRCKICKVGSKASSLSGNAPWVDPRDSVWCPKKCGGWCAAPKEEGTGTSTIRCPACGASSTIDPKTLRTTVESAQSKMKEAKEALSALEVDKTITCLRDAVGLLTVQMPPSAYPLLSMLRTACEMFTSIAARIDVLERSKSLVRAQSMATTLADHYLVEATRLAMLVCTGMTVSNGIIFAEGHPTRAIALLTLGKLLISDAVAAFDESEAVDRSILPNPPKLPAVGMPRILMGRNFLLQALEELKIGFGKEKGTSGGDAAKHAQEILQNLDAEMRIFQQSGMAA
ncbi:SET domain-containing protein [Ceraceosorus guamensis]|uniref:SET domain-containing protein n=1 Tax=Ceraceosorus guamensis TaxID=1522189 RepID=A0A316W3X3_9BASI|nr:SET domain-containing protein [Ceraceosorus guamensis]PWN42295.1 SET domain-containing protein [Ceraceosorus guamensis]